MAKNKYNNTREFTESVTQPELTEVIGEDGMADMGLDTVSADNGINDSSDVEDVNQLDTIDEATQEDPSNIPTDENTDVQNDVQEKEPEVALPEAPPEPIVENTPEQVEIPTEAPTQEPTGEPKIIEPNASLGSDIKVLNDSSVSIEDKIRWCLTEAPNSIKSLANQLFAYNEAMKPSAIYNEQLMVNKQYELVSIYRSIFNIAEYRDFKVKFDVLNLFFAYYKDEGFAAQRLSRFDYLWKWSDVELNTLLHVSEVVSQLCLYAERVKRLKQLNLDMALDSTKTIVTEEARNNVIRYYKI